MPVPTSIDDLSTTAGSNSPSGSETPTEGDNYIRTLSSYIALLRDKLDGTSNTGTITNAAFSGTQTGAATWSALQTFSSGINVGGTTYTSFASFGTTVKAYKTATTSRNTTTTLTDDPHLSCALTTGVWSIDAYLPIAVAASGGPNGWKFALAFSGTKSNDSVTFLSNEISLASVAQTAIGSSVAVASVSNGTVDWIHVKGTVNVTVSGNLTVQWAQNSSGAQNLSVLIGAYLVCTKLS